MGIVNWEMVLDLGEGGLATSRSVTDESGQRVVSTTYSHPMDPKNSPEYKNYQISLEHAWEQLFKNYSKFRAPDWDKAYGRIERLNEKIAALLAV